MPDKEGTRIWWTEK